MISFQTNVNALVAQQNLNINNEFQSKTIQQLTSGYRINSAGDDAAGLAVANQFRNETAELTQGVSNGNDGVAQLQIMDGGMSNIGQILDRLKTLSMQSASASFTGDRTTLNSEFQTDVQEIDRQAQSIGLNTGGAFAKNLGVYIGAGSGSQSTSNSVVNVNLSNATVDSTSLGLTTNQSLNANGYDLGASSNTSVAKIISDASNKDQAGGQTATFTFNGQGFGGSQAVSVTVDLGGVTDTSSLVTAINNAITNQGNTSGNANTAFKLAGISASIVTDAKGNQELAFDSQSAFQVTAGNNMANALMGNFNTSGQKLNGDTTTVASGQSASSSALGTVDLNAAHDFSGTAVTLTFANTGAAGTENGGVGGTTSNTVTLNRAYSSAQAAADDINSQIAASGDLKNSGISASIVNGHLQINSTSGAVSITASAAGSGFATSAANTGTLSTFSTYNASGTSQLGTSSGSSSTPTDLDYTALAADDTQSLAVSANDASGNAHSLNITLNQATGTNGDATAADAVNDINKALQASGDSTLQGITAVVSNDNGAQKINFVSNETNFSLSVNAATTAGKGITVASTTGADDATAGKLSSTKVGSGGSVDISTMAGAQSAVAAITKAVSALGSAQAAIGKGENQLNYAIGLAQSQITNFSSAEAQIRDADVATEAANLTKAQVLQQASIAAMAQANSAPQALLSLLKG